MHWPLPGCIDGSALSLGAICPALVLVVVAEQKDSVRVRKGRSQMTCT